MYYIFCCDISTLRCTATDLEQKIANFSTRYHKLSDSLWFYCVPRDEVCHLFLSPDEYFVTHVIHDYLSPESIVYTCQFPKRNYYFELPQDAVDFLSIDEPDE